MNSEACLNVILKKIQENVCLFEKNNDLQKLISVLLKLGREAIEKKLSSSVLKNIILTVKQLHERNIINKDDYKEFIRNVNNFYKSHSLCDNYKLAILSCFSPAVELELLSLLKLCSNVRSVMALDDIQAAVERSVLIQACQINIDITKKVTRILKEAFTICEGNPIVAYLTFCFWKSIEFSSHNSYLLSKELSCLDALFQIPYHVISIEDGELLIRNLINLCFDCEKMKLCTKNDLIFYTAIFPACYRKMLELCDEKTYILDFFTFLCNNNSEFSKCKNIFIIAQGSQIWQFLTC